jgi:hypothetical protein
MVLPQPGWLDAAQKVIRPRSPHQIVRDHEVLIGVIRLNGGLSLNERNYHILVTLTNALGDSRWYHGVVASVPHDHELAASQLLSPLSVHGHAADLLTINEAVVILGFQPWDPILLNDLLDLRDPSLALSFLLPTTIQLLVACDFSRLCLLRCQRGLRLGGRAAVTGQVATLGGLVARILRRRTILARTLTRRRLGTVAELPLLLLLCRLARLFLGHEAGRQ